MMAPADRYWKRVLLGSALLDLLLLHRFGREWRRQKELTEQNKKSRAGREGCQEFFRRVCGQQKELSRIKHDLNNNLQIICTLLEEGETQQAQDYLKEMICRLPEG